ncbi:MAG: hypothetical protein GXO29_06230 [Thermotogae bacterium]|nr:hypothetical protein [Thermotogota bacterium]
MGERFERNQSTEILLLGIGGAGCNIVDQVAGTFNTKSIPYSVDVFAINTDRQNLQNLENTTETIQIGRKGRGAGSDPLKGRRLALEAIARGELNVIKHNDEKEYDLIIVVAGLGGGTGTGAGPVIVENLRDMFPEAVILGILIYPEDVESGIKTDIARQGLAEYYRLLDSVVVINNGSIVNPNMPIAEAYKLADEYVANTIMTILNISEDYGKPNLDFNDIQKALEPPDRGRDDNLSKFAFISTFEVPSANDIQKVYELLNTKKRHLSINSLSGARTLLVGFFHTGKNLTWEKEVAVVDHLKKEIIIAGRSPYVKIGDFTKNKDHMLERVHISVIVSGVKPDSYILNALAEAKAEQELEEILKGFQDEGGI